MRNGFHFRIATRGFVIWFLWHTKTVTKKWYCHIRIPFYSLHPLKECFVFYFEYLDKTTGIIHSPMGTYQTSDWRY